MITKTAAALKRHRAIDDVPKDEKNSTFRYVGFRPLGYALKRRFFDRNLGNLGEVIALPRRLSEGDNTSDVLKGVAMRAWNNNHPLDRLQDNAIILGNGLLGVGAVGAGLAAAKLLARRGR